MPTRWMIAGLAVWCSLSPGCTVTTSHDSFNAADSVKRVQAQAGSPRKQALGNWVEGVPSWSTPTFSQRYVVRGLRDVDIMERQYDTQAGQWSEVTHHGDAGFDIFCAASARQDLFCFAGFAGNGDLVLEQWTAEPVVRAAGGETIPVLTTEGMVVKGLRKVEIYRGPVAEELIALEFDAEGRFMLSLVRSGTVFALLRFDNEPSATPVVVSDSLTIPELAVVKRMRKLHHQTYGRVWELQDEVMFSIKVAFLDQDNDGVFDGSPLIGNRAFFAAAGFEDYDSWLSLLGP